MSVIELKVPVIGESITEVTLSKWLKPDGAFVSIDEILCEFESDKATLEFPSETSGILQHIAKEGDDLAIGAIIGKIDTSRAEDINTKQQPEAEIKIPAEKPGVQNPSSAATKIIPTSNQKIEEIKDSDKKGKTLKTESLQTITGKESENQIGNINTSETKSDKPPLQETDSNTLLNRMIRREKLSRMRRTISKRLVAAKNETAMLTTFNEVDMSQIIDLRTKYNEFYQAKYGVKIGFVSIFAKACSTILLQIPEVNARLENDDIIYHDYVDISLAISTSNGLVVPPIRNVELMKIHEIESQLKILAEKARNNKLSLEEMSGGTFTITNGGIFGSLMSTPILNEPQSAILGMHSIKDRPVAVNGQIVIRPMMYLALSYDHRVIDGSSSVTFLVKVKELLEDPIKLLLEI